MAPTPKGMQYRVATVDRTALEQRAGQQDDRIPVAISSETPVSRLYGDEVLSHDLAAIDLAYARAGLPFLLDHDTRDQIGIVENIRVDADKVLRGDVRFSASTRAQEIRRDFLDGIRQNISVGYRVNDMTPDKQGKRFTATDWTPMEVSSVAIPADITVGAGRQVEFDLTEPTPPASEAEKERSMGEYIATPAAATPDIEQVTASVREQATKEMREILAITEKHNVPAEKRDFYLSNGWTVQQVSLDVLRGLQTPPVVTKPAVELTEKEQKRYSLANLMNVVASESRASCFEMEVSQELEKKMPAGVERKGGFLVPTISSREALNHFNATNGPISTRAGLDSATSTKGAEAKFTVPGDFLPLLRNRMVVGDAGATFMAGLTGPVAFVNQNGAGTASWVAENPGSDVADSNLTLQQITLSPKTLTSTTSYSRQLLAQSSYDIDGIVRQDLAAIIAIELDRAAIDGTGASNQPTGILATSNVDITSVVGGTNGAQPTFANIVDIESLLCKANADVLGQIAYVTTPQIRGRLKQTVTVSGSTVGLPIWTNPGAGAVGAQVLQGGGSRQAGEVNGYLALASQNVPSNKTKGASSGICHVILGGVFSQLVIGDWGMYELVVDPYRLKKQGMIELTVFAMYGVAVKYPAAFVAMVDALK